MKTQKVPLSRLLLTIGGTLLAGTLLIGITTSHFVDSWMEEADRILKNRGDLLAFEFERSRDYELNSFPIPAGFLSGEEASLVLIEFSQRDGNASWRDPHWPINAWPGLSEGGGFKTVSTNTGVWRVMSLTKNDLDLRLALDISEIMAERNAGLGKSIVSLAILALLAGGVTATLWAREQRAQEVARKEEERFSANASHEMLTPLATMQARIGLALSDANVTEREARLMADLSMEVHKMRGVIDAMLLISRSEAGNLKLERKPVNITKVLGELCEASRNELEEKEINVQFEASQNTVISADGLLLRLAFSNLLRNAGNYNFPNGFVHVELTEHCDSGRLRDAARISIKNSGPPIPVIEVPLVFERFHRGTTARHTGTPGHGLGLGLTKAIVEAHGGELLLSESSEAHTEFVVELPMKR